MTEPRRKPPAEPGPAVDFEGRQVIDPTANVRELVTAQMERLADLRQADLRLTEYVAEAAVSHFRELMGLRSEYDEKLRVAESARIDAIRSVDVNAVQRAAEVSAAQAATLATQVAVSAETLRAQVAAAQTAAATSLAAALEPIQKDIADLRRVQYETQGVKAQTGESRLNLGAVLGVASLLLVVVFGTIGVILSIVAGG